MQGKTTAGDDVRQFPVLIHEFIEIQIIVSHNKLNIHIRKLCLDVGREAVEHVIAPQVDRDGLCILPFPGSAAA